MFFSGQTPMTNTNTFNMQRQPTGMFATNNMFPQYNQNVNKSDTEFKAVLDTYSSLYNSKDSQCLFRLPVFNPTNATQPKLMFNGNVMNQQELEYLWINAEQRLNPDPVNLSTCLLIGLENIQKRVQIDKEICQNVVKQLDQEIAVKVKEINHQLEGDTMKKIATIRKNNASILKRVISFEKKLFSIARKLKRADVNLEFKMNVMNMLKELWKQMIIIDKNIGEIRYMIDGKELSRVVFGQEELVRF